MKISDPFHPGEVEVQELLGERSTALLNGRLYEDSVIGPAHKFLAQLPYFVISAETKSGEIAVSVLVAEPGFISVTDDGKQIQLDLSAAAATLSDPVLACLKDTKRVGGLAIDLGTRRRLRVNGHVRELNADKLVIEVDESYPNCPKYIQKRTFTHQSKAAIKSDDVGSGESLRTAHLELITKADTFFVASSNPHGHLDASHRGGPVGFVKILDGGLLRIPDYAGNSLYNTLGNFKLNPQAGLVFWDFENAQLLHLFGEVRFDFGAADLTGETGGTGRWWEFVPKRWVTQSISTSYTLSAPEFSPFNPPAR